MTSPTDDWRAQQRMALIMLGDLLELGLPLAHWQVFAMFPYEGMAHLTGWIGDTQSGTTTHAQAADHFMDWARYFGVQPRVIGDQAWCLEAEVQGVRIEVKVILSPEYMAVHQPPPLLPQDVPGQYVRRTTGQLVEVTER